MIFKILFNKGSIDVTNINIEINTIRKEFPSKNNSEIKSEKSNNKIPIKTWVKNLNNNKVEKDLFNSKLSEDGPNLESAELKPKPENGIITETAEIVRPHKP